MLKLQDLPYGYDALQPYMSSETLEYHHDKHHQAYINFVNDFVKNNPQFSDLSLADIIKTSAKDKKLSSLFNNAAQIFNHNEFWPSLKKHETTKIPSELEKKIIEDFGSIDKFKSDFVKSGSTLFGSGWVWLTLVNGKLTFLQYQNGGNTLPDNHPAILGCDVWEHSYYIDYRNKRPDYLNAFINNLVNWEYTAEQYSKAIKG